MKIGYDAKRLFTNFTGLGNYSRNLVSHYHRHYPEDELYLFSPKVIEDLRTKPFLEDTSYNIIQPKGVKPLWRSLDIVKDIYLSGAQIYHGLSHELPLGISKLNIGKIVTMHDLIFKYFPQDYSWIDRQIYDRKWKHASMAADSIIAISEQTKSDLIHYYNVHPDKIKVIYQSADPVFSKTVHQEEMDASKKKYKIPDEYNLYVGSLISRKNLLSVIKAMIIIKEADRIPLVVIGNGNNYRKKVINAAIEGGIGHLLLWLGSPPFEDFPSIYKGAQMMIYPSFHEGYGLPVVEAMLTGIPVITSNQSSLKEAGGDAAKLIDPQKPEELAAAMLQIQFDFNLRNEMVRKGSLHVEKLAFANGIEQLQALYEAYR